MKSSLKAVMVSASLVASLALAGCAPAAEEPTEEAMPLTGLTGVVGAKDFSEQYILGNMVSLLLNENGADTTYQTIVGSANVRTALESDEFMGYWEYTGTSWLAYNEQDAPVKGVQAQYDAVKELDAAKGIAWLDGAAVNNTYAFAIRSEKAAELGIDSLSDIAALPAAEQTFCVESEFASRPDGWEGLKAAYGLTNAKTVTLDTGAIYSVTDKGEECNFGEVFATDGRIKALDLKVMADDKEYFPVYQVGFTLKQSTLDAYPAIAEVINKLTALLTDEIMQELNAKADVDGEDPEDIAREFLVSKGLIKG
ncbi:glycine betaine ABC transporter substrate-binding protein [Candidatus Rhodoluna planktonica]|uniref:Glycine/betaine ABC transporter substrate-binding protein n=1 Tax=Candidatus Rhodoluna planktonica TaxID=535712 RepID=A0A1D9DXI1_9MICO|nr:glycine betaine ABC transporter substrate-binding protein [Candidatus Rhodoluna planktonica]AOY55511.1 glycine/betaine ABC transporter substrate-binding protein [Candidatus Rhodoluna planktonica]